MHRPHLRRLASRTGRVLRMAATLTLATMLAVPIAAWASHQFDDVPDSNIFHDDIAWMKANGVTSGCGGNDFCPDSNVTREQMSAFMRRLETKGVFLTADGKATDADKLDGLDSSAFLGATDKAVDADELDGRDWTFFASDQELEDALDDHVGLVDVASSTGVQTATTASYETLTGASATVTVPTGHTAILQATFSGESACSGGAGYCVVTLYVDGVEMAPAVGVDFAFDSTNAGNETSSSWEAHTMMRTTAVGAGTYTVTVKFTGDSGGTTLRLDDWTLFVQAHLTS